MREFRVLSAPPATRAFSTLFHLVYFCLLLPARAVQQYRRKPAEPAGPPRRIPYSAGVLRTLQMGGISLVTAWAAGVRLFPAALPSVRDIGLAVASYAAMFLVSLPEWRHEVRTNARHVARWLPRNGREQLQFAGLCGVIGVTEEITWRGVQVALLQRLIGWWPLAILVCALMFGLIHLWQGRRSVFTAGGFALVLHALVWVTGSLYTAMVVHAAIDLTAAIYLVRQWPRSGYPFVEEPSPTR